MINAASNEQCDDGNILSGDGCSSCCQIEPGWTCLNIFQGFLLEVPSYKSTCTLTVVTVPTPPATTIQEYFQGVTAQEFMFTGYNVVNQTAGKFRLIEYGLDQTLYGVSFVASGVNAAVAYAYEYTKVKQSVGGATTYFETHVDMTPNNNLK